MFMGNFEKYFACINAEDALFVAAQRPACVIPGLDHDQFRQFAFRTFERFIHQLPMTVQNHSAPFSI
jgi:hypothetical protein